MERKKKKKKRLKKSVKFILLLCLIALIFLPYKIEVKNQISKESKITNESKIKEQKYQECMSTPYQSEGLEEEFTNLFASYDNNVAIVFTDINNDYSYSKNPDKVYYSASAIKVFDAIYLIENNIDLETTITLTPEYRSMGSEKLREHKAYEKISLKNLIDYELSVSDNGAHAMLVNYIGAKNINQYFKENGNINVGISSGNIYSYNYTADIANQSLERIYDIIQKDDESSKLIKTAMDNDYANSLSFDNINIIHKYGLYDAYYHDIGIYLDKYPYLVSILTLYGNTDYKEKVQKISQELYNIYNNNIKNKETYCQSLQ